MTLLDFQAKGRLNGACAGLRFRSHQRRCPVPLPPDPRPTSGQDARKRRTAASLLGAARELFADLGFRAVTVEQIAAQAGLSVGSVYVHYGSKEALYLRVVDDALRLSDDYARRRRWSESPLQRVYNTGEAYLSFARDHPAAFRLVSVQLPEQDKSSDVADLHRQVSARLGRQITLLSGDVRAAIDAGEIQPMPVRHVLVFLWAAWSGVVTMSLRDDLFAIDPDDVPVILRVAAAALSRGIAPADPPTISCGQPVGGSAGRL